MPLAHTIRFFPSSVDPHAFSPLEAAHRNHFLFRPSVNREMDELFCQHGIDRLVPPGATISGFGSVLIVFVLSINLW